VSSNPRRSLGGRNRTRPFSVGLLEKGGHVSILWIILIVVLVLALLGFFGRGRW
jgi:hypothetical protein